MEQNTPVEQAPAQPITPQVTAVEKKAKKPVWKRWWFWTAIVILGIIGISSSNGSTTTPTASSNGAKAAVATTSTPTATPTPATRQVKGTAVTLGAGTFTGGKDVVAGLYDVTTQAGESGNFSVTNTEGLPTTNEILGVFDGQGVSKVRTPIASGDTIQISSLSHVIFTPVTAPFVTTYQAATLYAGTFTVGQDIGAGRYVATTTAGKSGNFSVTNTDGLPTTNEILGVFDGQGVPNVTANLVNGDTIQISSLNQVSFAPSN